ncbi:MAG: hypothetical protein HY300_19530, partial [Verrucomicrobia bacterium]|nr:hypothetical protein [Verrucomicrobiota bacterium]
QYKLRGYSHGSSNHLAQDLGVMLEVVWLLLKDSTDAADKRLAAEVAEAAKNLHQCRMNHHGHIPAVCAAYGLSNGLADELRRIPDGEAASNWTPANHYVTALRDFKPGQRCSLPGFADDHEYTYYSGIARHGTLPRPLAFKVIYDAFTQPMLYRIYSDDAEVPPGINRFDLHPYYFKDGKPEDYRSDRKGPNKGPRPIGSRFGPQNMVVTGWALQAMKERPRILAEQTSKRYVGDFYVGIYTLPPRVLRFPRPALDDAPDRHVPILFRLEPVEMPAGSVVTNLHLSCGSKTLELGFMLGKPNDIVNDVVIRIFGEPDAKGNHIEFKFMRGKLNSVVNEKGELMLFESVEGAAFCSVPFSCSKGQKAWWNIVEHGRGSIQIADQTRNLCFASLEQCVQPWLEFELGRGLRTWASIFKQYGYIPTGIGAGSMGGGYTWEDMSDTGGYAHLISACAEWLLYLDGKRDWEIQNVPAVLKDK